MDRLPAKPLDSPRQSRRRGTTPPISETPHPPQPAPAHGSTTTPLPSIRHLHPHLPPPNQYFGPTDPSAYPSSSFEHPPQSGPVRYQPPPAHQDPTKELPTIEESDSDKHSSPPPKKRRKRQALSCTECKRRKIKCDRTQPCGPCARRGEQDKCQWHQVETNDKYVTRAEYDLLKARVDHLEHVLAGIAGASSSVHMQPTMAGAPTMPTGAGHPNPPYVHHSRSTSGSYGLGPEYAPDPYSVNTRHSVTALPSSSRTTLSGDINPPATEREISASRQYPSPHRPASRQFRSTLGSVPPAPPYGSTEGTDERPKKRFAWTLQGVRPRQSCRAVDLVRQSQLYSTLLPCLSLLVCILYLLTRRLLQLVRPRSSRWKSLPKPRPTTDPIPQEDYGTTGHTATQSPLWLYPQSGPVTAASRRNPPSLPVTNDPCRTPENGRSPFLGLGCANRPRVLG